MSEIYNIYCDESCHLENDHQKAMVLGAIWCPLDKIHETSVQIRKIKEDHNLNPFFEIKWIKISPAKLDFYQDLVEYFFKNEHLHFRALIVPDKTKLQHQAFKQTHDDWYYKMYFDMLKVILNPNDRYRIYLDIKDTRGTEKLEKLHEVLTNAHYDFNREMITRMQHVHSHDICLLQIADILIGLISYKARNLTTSPAENELIEYVKQKSGRSLEKNTLPTEVKFNLCFWKPNGGEFSYV